MQDNREITNEEVQKASEIINNLLSYYNSKVVGQPYLGYSLLVAMMTNGHVLRSRTCQDHCCQGYDRGG